MFKKITELFSGDSFTPETTTHTASASLSADTIRDLERRKRALVDDIARIAAEITAHGLQDMVFEGGEEPK